MTAVKRTEDFLNDVIQKMQVAATVSVNEVDHQIEAKIEGEDAGILIGREGRTLDAIQLLTNLIINKGQEERLRIIVDVEGYKDKRKENLERLAHSLAEKVAKEKEPVSMEPMNAFERRVIHMALRESTAVITESQGEAGQRHVVIKPL